jgi:nucleotide-binding universal stress UspA family protein
MNRSAHRAPEPVHRTFLVPLVGSHFAEGALPTARALAARFGATIHTVTVTVSDFERQGIRAEAAHALGTAIRVSPPTSVDSGDPIRGRG